MASQVPPTDAIDDAENSAAHRYQCACGAEFAVVPDMVTACVHCGAMVDLAAPAIAPICDAITISVDEMHSHGFEASFSSSVTNKQLVPLSQLSGMTLGHFKLERLLGSGGMGAVYDALDTSLQRRVAVKVIRDVRSPEDQHSLTSAIVREAVAQARLNHPSVVTIYYVGRSAEEPFLAMELVEGQTLRQRINSDGPLKYADAIRITKQLSNALDHASRINIVHGDIKPNNLLINAAGNVKLSDFGLARSTSESNRKGPLSGTPAYMAPELMETSEVSIQSDMYAVGVTLFEMIFGRLPFRIEGDSVRDQLLCHLHQEISYPTPWPRELPTELKSVLNRLLAKSPHDRFDNYVELQGALERIEPVSTTVAGIATRAVAFAVDQLILLTAFLPFALPIYLATNENPLFNTVGIRFQNLIVPIAVLSLVVPLGFLTYVRLGKRTLGQYLFQLRVTEQHGLPLTSDQAAVRALLRNSTAWLLPLGLYAGLYFSLADELTYVVILILLLLEVIFAVSSAERRSLHDLFCHTRVVLDSKPSNQVIKPIVETRRAALDSQLVDAATVSHEASAS